MGDDRRELSWREAALAVLEQSDVPMSALEIVERIRARGLKSGTRGKTPHKTVGAQLYVAIREGDPRVRKHSKGRFVYAGADPPSDSPAELLGKPAVKSVEPAAATLTFLDAAERVLQTFADRHPLHYEEITRRAVEAGWLRSEGLTPAATMNSQLVTDIRRRRERGDPPRFTKRGRGVFGLAVWESAGLLGAIEHHRRDVRGQLFEQVRELSAGEFEALVGALLAAMGVEATEVTSYSRDQGVDVRGELVVADVIRRPVAVQVKHWRTANVRAPAVRELRGSLGPHEIGLIITSRGFSEGALVEAQRTDVTPIALMGGDELIDALIRYDIGVRKRDVELLEVTAFDLAEDTADGEDDSLL